MLTLYHGTSTAKLPGILSNGLTDGAYLTDAPDLATYYADVAVDEFGGEMVVLQVTVLPKNLRYDGHAMDEPVSFGAYSITELEERVSEAWKRAAGKHPKWVFRGSICIPETKYQLSLETVSSCWHKGNISPDHIQVIDGTP